MVVNILLLLLLCLLRTTSAQDCNICGDGNFIGFPQGVVTIMYQGEARTNNCQTWQAIVKNPVAISDDFCRNELIYYTAEPCRCYTPDGKMVMDLLNGVPRETPAPVTKPPPESSNTCQYQGTQLVCDYGLTVPGEQEGMKAQVNFRAKCDGSANVGFDFRRAPNCQCSASVFDLASGSERTCPCTVCAAELGEFPVSVDCSGLPEDPFIVDDCSVLDCNAACVDPDRPAPPTDEQPAGNVYTSGSTTVTVTQEIIDANNSNKKCVEYTSGAPEKWEKGCFTTTFSDGGTFVNCDVQFGDHSCSSCQPCETDNFEVGYAIDCFNIEPEENTQGLCVLLSDDNIQEVLVDKTFQSQQFVWSNSSVGAPVDVPTDDMDHDCSFHDDFDLAGDGSLLLRRFINPMDRTVTVELEYQGEGWIGMAFSEGGLMVPSIAVLGLPDEGGVKKHELSQRALPGVTAIDSTTLTDTSITQENGITKLKFTKPLEEVSEVAVSSGENRIIWAYGSSNTLGYHAARGSSMTPFDECSPPVSSTPTDPPGEHCNICGDGNSITAPQAVIEFEDQGSVRKFDCQQLQDLVVSNPTAIDGTFCRTELVEYALVPCGCRRPDGSLVAQDVEPKNPTQSPNETIDFEGCFADLHMSDRNRDGAVNVGEYLFFIQRYGRRVCYSTEKITLEQTSAFNSLACSCLSKEGADESCCLGENAMLSTAGTLDPESRTPEQLEFLTSVCRVTDSTLGERDCDNLPTTTAPGPTKSPSVDSITSSPTFFCFDNLADVHEFVEGKAFSTVETVVLCPNTVFDVDAQMPLYLRSNTRYLCGADGLSSNDCRLTGGLYQLLSSPRLFDFEDTIGVLVQGMTFDNSRVTGAVLSNSGDVAFVDCIFKNHKGRMAVSMIYIPLPEGRRQLERLDDGSVSFERKQNEINAYYTSLLINATAWENLMSSGAEPSTRRNQQARRQRVSFERCLFQSNTANSNMFIPNSGVIAVKSAFNELVIDSCLFVDNDTGEPSSNLESLCGVYLMQSESEVQVTNSCFLNNDFTGQGTITVQSSASVIDVTGNYVSEDDNLRCPLLAVGTDECEEATRTLDLCEALEAAAPKRMSNRSGGKNTAVASRAKTMLRAGALQFTALLFCLWPTLP